MLQNSLCKNKDISGSNLKIVAIYEIISQFTKMDFIT